MYSNFSSGLIAALKILGSMFLLFLCMLYGCFLLIDLYVSFIQY